MKAILSLIGVILVMFATLALMSFGFDAYNQSRADDCLTAVEAAYDANWEGECARLERGAECALPGDIADTLKAERVASNTLCVDRYAD